jgi:hypothetical protein
MLASPGLKQNLITAAGSLIATALQNGRPPAVAKPCNEPTAVAAVTWVGLPDVVAQWRPVLRRLGFTLSLHSVFCHQSPQVSFNDKNNAPQLCELADLLIVVDEKVSGTIRDRRAVFVQAKMFSGGKISITALSRDQLELYETWPLLTFVSGPYQKIARDFTATGQPGSSSESGRYGGIDLPQNAPLWENIVPSTTPAMRRGNGMELARFVAGMVVGDAAVGRAAKAGGSDDWSMTVDEILSITAGQSVWLAASIGKGVSRPRGETSPIFVTPNMADFAASSMPPAPPSGGPPGDDTILASGPEEGISFVRLIFARAD